MKASEPKLPQFLQQILPNVKVHGTLKKEEFYYIIEGEPYLLETVRRIFPGTENDEPGKAYIPATPATIGDLNWLMLKYPLRVLTYDAWMGDITKAREETIKQMVWKEGGNREFPPVTFLGNLFDFQHEAYNFLLANPRTLLGDQMGLGKTISALATVAKLNAYPIIIVPQAHLTYQWINEIHKFLGTDMKCHIITGKKMHELPMVPIYIIHYGLLAYWHEALCAMAPSAVIFDEVQELRHHETIKYDAAQRISKASQRAYGLSGTPIYNKGVEIYNVFDVINPGILGERRYFLKEWGDKITYGNIAHPERLGAFLTNQGLLLRRRKSEVLKELPKKRRAYQVINADHQLYLKLTQESLEMAQQIKVVPKKEVGLLLLQISDSVRRATGVAKALGVIEFTRMVLAAGEPCILFAFHHDVMDLYAKYLQEYNPLFITGRENREQKQTNVDAFMKGESNLLILNLRTTSGLNLQRARVAIFGELDWSPAVHAQAEDRIHRIGQDNDVMIYYLNSKFGSDEEMTNLLQQKLQQFTGLMRDDPLIPKETFLDNTEAQRFMWNIVEQLQKFREGEEEST